jgi:elongator complex protein 5
LLATFHTSIPLPSSPSVNSNPYEPSFQALLTYLATTLITIESLHHVLAEKRARERAHAPPNFGLESGEEGVLLGEGANGAASLAQGGQQIVLKVEHRRKSGRGVYMEFVYSSFGSLNPVLEAESTKSIPTPGSVARFVLLEEHPLYAPPKVENETEGDEGDEITGTTFNLSLTDKQRKDREGVVLPYFDAQKGEGPGEGGRILYQMGEEDLGDWDEEDDEI